MLETVNSTYYRKLALSCILTILLGAVLTELLLYYSLARGPGSSYAENYSIMAALRSELFHKSTAIYVAISVFMAIGIAVIALLYSFRVAGPVHRLGVFARSVASGDLSGTVKLRHYDVIHMMADDLNELAAEYKEVVARVDEKTMELKEIVGAIGESKDDDARDTLAKLRAKSDEINRILANIKL